MQSHKMSCPKLEGNRGRTSPHTSAGAALLCMALDRSERDAVHLQNLILAANEEDEHDFTLRKRGQNMLDPERIRQALQEQGVCYHVHCTDVFSIEQVIDLRKPFALMSDMDRRITLATMDGVWQHSTHVAEQGKCNDDKLPLMKGKDRVDVCVTAFKTLLGISSHLWKKVLHLARTPDPAAHEVHLCHAHELTPQGHCHNA